jgi:hypothetical protein
MYREYWRSVRHDTEQHLIATGWYHIQGKLDLPANEIAAALEEALGPGKSFIAFNLQEAYQKAMMKG